MPYVIKDQIILMACLWKHETINETYFSSFIRVQMVFDGLHKSIYYITFPFQIQGCCFNN